MSDDKQQKIQKNFSSSGKKKKKEKIVKTKSQDLRLKKQIIQALFVIRSTFKLLKNENVL